MKRIIALILAFSMLLTGCSVKTDTQVNPLNTPDSVQEDTEDFTEIQIPLFNAIESEGLLEFVEDSIYSTLFDNLDPEEYFVEEVTTKYISKEYLNETEYNSLENIFFGYNISELNDEFLGTKYVFTVDEAGSTTVLPLEAIDDSTYNQVVKNVAIGSGVILVSVSVALVTKSLPASVSAGKTVRVIFTVSSTGAKAGTVLAAQSAAIAGTVAGFAEALATGDPEMVAESMALAASNGFKFGAIGGAIKGISEGIKILGNWRYFREGTIQASKYPEGVEFTEAANGEMYPRFEKWAIKTVKLDKPTLENVIRKKCLSGDYARDAALANAKIGLGNTPAGYVWHHVEDMQTMLLIPQDLHSVAKGGMRHKGGASLLQKYLSSL